MKREGKIGLPFNGCIFDYLISANNFFNFASLISRFGSASIWVNLGSFLSNSLAICCPRRSTFRCQKVRATFPSPKKRYRLYCRFLLCGFTVSNWDWWGESFYRTRETRWCRKNRDFRGVGIEGCQAYECWGVAECWWIWIFLPLMSADVRWWTLMNLDFFTADVGGCTLMDAD
jgi:hypothetical protein